jgi:hypothetical protein
MEERVMGFCDQEPDIDHKQIATCVNWRPAVGIPDPQEQLELTVRIKVAEGTLNLLRKAIFQIFNDMQMEIDKARNK